MPVRTSTLSLSLSPGCVLQKGALPKTVYEGVDTSPGSKLAEADLKVPSVTNCFPVRAPLLLPVPGRSQCSEPTAAAQEGSEWQLTVL